MAMRSYSAGAGASTSRINDLTTALRVATSHPAEGYRHEPHRHARCPEVAGRAERHLAQPRPRTPNCAAIYRRRALYAAIGDAELATTAAELEQTNGHPQGAIEPLVGAESGWVETRSDMAVGRHDAAMAKLAEANRDLVLMPLAAGPHLVGLASRAVETLQAF